MSFTVQTMLGGRALVQGTDINGTSGKCLVSTIQWDELNARDAFSQAQADFDAEVEAFFKPLTKAAKKAKKALAVPSSDPVAYVVVDKGSKGKEARPRQVVALSHDSIILRLIEENQTDRLVWVNESTLGVVAG